MAIVSGASVWHAVWTASAGFSSPPACIATGADAAADAINGGAGAIFSGAPDQTAVGVIDPAGTSERPIARRVTLFDRRAMIPIRSTVSDPATGAYRFENLRTDVPFLIMADDHLGNYNAVVADWQYAR